MQRDKTDRERQTDRDTEYRPLLGEGSLGMRAFHLTTGTDSSTPEEEGGAKNVLYCIYSN